MEGGISAETQHTSLRPELTSPEQPRFSDRVKNIVLIPVRNEWRNGQFEQFLRQIAVQQFALSEGIGLLFLVNDNKRSQEDEARDSLDDSVTTDNNVTRHYLELLSKQDEEAVLKDPTLDEKAKQLALELIRKGVEVRFGYRDTYPLANMGEVRNDLFEMTGRMKPESVAEKDIILHMMDVDVSLSPNHFARLSRFYSNKDNQGNLSDWDLVPGSVEGKMENDEANRQLLTTFDSMRLYWILNRLKSSLFGGIASSTPTISGRFSLINTPEIKNILLASRMNEDFSVGTALRDKEGIGSKLEVYQVDRARNMGRFDVFDSGVRQSFSEGGELTFSPPDLNMKKLQRRIREGDINLEGVFCADLGDIKGKLEAYGFKPPHIGLPGLLYQHIDQIAPVLQDEIEIIAQKLSESIPELARGLNYAKKHSPKLYSFVLLRTISYVDTFKSIDSEKKDQEQGRFSDRVLHILTDYKNIFSPTYFLPDQAREIIEAMEKLLGHAILQFPEDEHFQKLLRAELQEETIKVRLRSMRLLQTIDYLTAGTKLPQQTSPIVQPFLDTFPEVIEEIKGLYQEGARKEAIAKHIKERFTSFFNPEDSIHQQIAIASALNKYAVSKRINLE